MRFMPFWRERLALPGQGRNNWPARIGPLDLAGITWLAPLDRIPSANLLQSCFMRAKASVVRLNSDPI